MKHLFQMSAFQMYNKFENVFGAQFELETLSASPTVAIVAMGSEANFKSILHKEIHATKMQNLVESNTKA